MFNKVLLRNKIKDRGLYARTVTFAVFIYLFYEFVTFNDSSVYVDSTTPMVDFGGYFQLTIPRAYNYFSQLAISENPTYYPQEIIPFLLTLLSATLTTWKRILSMKYNLKQGYVRKMQVFVTEKIKILDEAEINLQKVDRSGNLLPRKVSRNSNIVKRHRAIHEGAARKKVILKS